MKTASATLLKELEQEVKLQISEAEALLKQPLEKLNQQPAPEKWSVLECIEHLNLYSDFYLPAFERQMKESKHQSAAATFKSGWLGNYFAVNMLPKQGMKTMNTFKDKNPSGSNLNAAVLEHFIQDQKQLLRILEAANKVDIQRTKCPITISKMIKLRLGDTFRFIINHQRRHLVQAQNALSA